MTHGPRGETASRSTFTRALVVLREAFGFTLHIEDVCTRLLGDGRLSVAPIRFHRLGSPTYGYDNLSRAREAMNRPTLHAVQRDVRNGFELVQPMGVGPEQTVAVGFWADGSLAFQVAARFPPGAAAAFYGAGLVAGRFGASLLVDLTPSVVSPWLGLLGDLAPITTPPQVDPLRVGAARALVDADIVPYSDAGHDFRCDDRPSHFHATPFDGASCRCRVGPKRICA